MKLFAITLLAVCLIQGNHAQLASLRNMVSSAASSVQSAAASATNAVEGAASGAVSSAKDVASNIRNRMSGGAQALIDSATSNVSVDQLTAAAANLSPQELLETVQGAVAEVEARVEAVQDTLEDTIASVSKQADAAVTATTKSWNSPVEAVLAKAKAVGVDVTECATNGVVDLGKSTATSAVKCVTDKVKEAVTLVKNVVNLPIRAKDITTNGVTGYRKCSTQRIALMKRACQAAALAPAAVKSALLVKDAVSYTTQATTLVSTIQTQLTACAGKVAVTKTAEAGLLAGKIVACVTGKITSAGAA